MTARRAFILKRKLIVRAATDGKSICQRHARPIFSFEPGFHVVLWWTVSKTRRFVRCRFTLAQSDFVVNSLASPWQRFQIFVQKLKDGLVASELVFPLVRFHDLVPGRLPALGRIIDNLRSWRNGQRGSRPMPRPSPHETPANIESSRRHDLLPPGPPHGSKATLAKRQSSLNRCRDYALALLWPA